MPHIKILKGKELLVDISTDSLELTDEQVDSIKKYDDALVVKYELIFNEGHPMYILHDLGDLEVEMIKSAIITIKDSD